METIKDYNRYTTLMKNGFYDKLFFIDKLFGDWKSLLDYGCADGFLTKLIAEIFPDKRIFGYDSDRHMVGNAIYTGSYPENVKFQTNLPSTEQPDVLLLSSVIHEVYSYGDKKSIGEFWDYVTKSGFKKIVVRDMLIDPSQNHAISQPGLRSIYVRNVREWCEKNYCLGELHRFEELHGIIDSPRSLLHFMLKYLYITSPNWERELAEDYLACDVSDVVTKISREGYRLIYKDTSSLAFLQHKWHDDFGVTDMMNTHSKLIFEKT